MPPSRASLIRAVRTYLKGCFRIGERPHVSELARLLKYQPWAFARTFRAIVGTSPGVYIKRLQLERAMKLLRETDHPINEVAYATGYGTRASLYRAFRTGIRSTPGQYRMKMRSPR